MDRVHRKVPTLSRVKEWHPSDVAEGEHISKAVGDHVHHKQDSALVVLAIQDTADVNRMLSDR